MKKYILDKKPGLLKGLNYTLTTIILLSLTNSLSAQSGQKQAIQKSEIKTETIRIDGPIPNLKLGLRNVRSTATKDSMVVLILHGAILPISANADFYIKGESKMTALAKTGLDVWGLDLYGYGESDDYPEMIDSANTHRPLGIASEAIKQVDMAVRYLLKRTGNKRIMLIGDSFGSLLAGIYATKQPSFISRLILFGPVTPFSSGSPSIANLPAYEIFAPEFPSDLFTKWADNIGSPEVLDKSIYKTLTDAYLNSSPGKRRTPLGIKVPNGWAVSMSDVANGRFPYNPSLIEAPTLVVMGESDEISTFPGAQWLLKLLRNAPEKRLVVIGHASHTVQYETGRFQLYDIMSEFLHEK